MNLLYRGSKNKKVGEAGPIDKFGGVFVNGIMAVSGLFQKNAATRLACVFCFTGFSLVTAWVLMPKAEYLPQGNQNIIMNILVPPPGYSAEKRHEVGEYLYRQISPYTKEDGKDGIPQVDDVIYISSDMFSFFGATCTDAHETEAKRLIPMLGRIMNSIPGMFGVSIQPGIFESQLGKGRTVDVNISGLSLIMAESKVQGLLPRPDGIRINLIGTVIMGEVKVGGPGMDRRRYERFIR